jgi:hypothetical protein
VGSPRTPSRPGESSPVRVLRRRGDGAARCCAGLAGSGNSGTERPGVPTPRVVRAARNASPVRRFRRSTSGTSHLGQTERSALAVGALRVPGSESSAVVPTPTARLLRYRASQMSMGLPRDQLSAAGVSWPVVTR